MLLPRLVALSLIAFSAMGAEDLFRAGVRTTEPMTPAEEQLGFDLPEGFSIQLVNSEPAISKPMNMAFDARGRLWVTDTLEYPVGQHCLPKQKTLGSTKTEITTFESHLPESN